VGLRGARYSVLPNCSVEVAVSFPNSPLLSSFGPAVKSSSVGNPLFAAPLPKVRPHSPSMASVPPAVFSIAPSCSPVAKLNA